MGVDRDNHCSLPRSRGQRSSLAVPTDLPVVPQLHPHIPHSPLYMYERPYLSVSWNPFYAVCAAHFNVDPGLEIGTTEYIYKRSSSALESHYQSRLHNGIT